MAYISTHTGLQIDNAVDEHGRFDQIDTELASQEALINQNTVAINQLRASISDLQQYGKQVDLLVQNPYFYVADDNTVKLVFPNIEEV